MFPFKNQSRAIRRHHRARLMQARKGYWGRQSGYCAPEWTPVCLGKVVDTPHPCSCWMCGNPRRQFGTRTIQEQRAMSLA